MISLQEFTITKVSGDDAQAVFEIGPLPKGFGQTLGNNLRRILLATVPGAAVTSVKIHGAQHEYTTLSGVSDDVLTVLLSLKNVVFRMKSEEPVTLKLKAKGSKDKVTQVTAADIEKDANVEVVNADYIITTLTDNTELNIELTVERGIGYAFPKEEVRQEVGMLPIDAIFSPVTLVNFTVTPTRVGQETELDQLNLTVHTDASVTPADALHIASSIQLEMANNFVNQTEDMLSGKALTSVPTTQPVTAKKKNEEISDDPIIVADLNMSTRLTNALLRAGFDDLRKLDGFTGEEIANIRGMGEKSIDELVTALEEHGIQVA